MADKILKIKKSTLVDIADQVRAKTGSTDKIKVKDLDEAVANLQGGGVVEVDVLPAATVVGEKGVLPASTYDINEENGDWTQTSEPVYVGNIYFNTDLSIEETVNTIKKVTQDLDAVYNKEMAVYEYYIYIDSDEDKSSLEIDLYNNFNRNDDGSKSYSDQWVIYVYQRDSEGNTIFDDYIFDTENGGWNPDFNGVISFNKTSVVDSYLEWNEDIDWVGNAYVVNGIVNMNSELVDLIYTGEEVPNPEFNPEAIYKLPDETLWIYENGWVELSKGGSKSSYPEIYSYVSVMNNLDSSNYTAKFSLDFGQTWYELLNGANDIATTLHTLPFVNSENINYEETFADYNNTLFPSVLISVTPNDGESRVDFIEAVYTYGNLTPYVSISSVERAFIFTPQGGDLSIVELYHNAPS